jgi:hypothetical protein
MKCPHCGQEIESFRKHGASGGLARLAKLTKERRSEIARKAAQSRWKDTPSPNPVRPRKKR